MTKYKGKSTAQLHREIADKVIENMKTAGTGWVKSWAVPTSEQPTSMSTGKAYQGINWLILGMARSAAGYKSGQWATYNQWFKMGGGIKDAWGKVTTPSKYNVRRGEKSETVILYKPIKIEDKVTGEEKTIRMIKGFNVFNADQIDGYDLPVDAMPEFIEMPVTAADQLAAAANIECRNGDDSSAFYSPGQDFVNMPKACRFKSPEDYAATLLHELTHATGHETRLDRNIKNSFGTKDYAAEELVAELGAAMLCGSLGISPEPREDHAQYLNSWIEKLTAEPKAIFSAAAKANAAAQWLIDAAEANTNKANVAA